jgi:hypothetical protein
LWEDGSNSKTSSSTGSISGTENKRKDDEHGSTRGSNNQTPSGQTAGMERPQVPL